MPSVFMWVLSKAQPEMRTWVQVVYWEVLLGRRSEEVDSEKEEEEKPRWGCVFTGQHCAQQDSVLLGQYRAPQTCPLKGEEAGASLFRLLLCVGCGFPLGVSPTLLGCTCTQAKKAPSEEALGEKVHRILIHSCCVMLSTWDEAELAGTAESNRELSWRAVCSRVTRVKCRAVSVWLNMYQSMPLSSGVICYAAIVTDTIILNTNHWRSSCIHYFN